jgi:hypothetical protein
VTTHTGGLACEPGFVSELLRAHRAIEVSDLVEFTELLAAAQGARRAAGRRPMTTLSGSGRPHPEGNAVDQARQGLRRARRQGPCHPQGPVCRQCRVDGFVVDTEFGIRRRARVQDNSAAWISRSQISVNSLM